MNAPTEAITTRTYKSEIAPLREKIDAIDAEIITILVDLQKFVYNRKLWDALIHTILCEEPASKYRELFTAALRSLRFVNEVWLRINAVEFEKGSITQYLERIVPLLDQRFEVVREVGALKWEFQEPPMDEVRWNYILTDRKEKWTQAWWTDAETIIPAIWNPIHDVAKLIERQIIERITTSTHIPYISRNVAAVHSHTPILGQVLAIGQNGGIYVKNTEDSPILQSHFQWMPVLPWVLSSHLLHTLLSSEDNNSIHHYKRTFHNPIRPGIHISQGTENKTALVDENWNILTAFSSSENFPEFSSEMPSQIEMNRKGGEWVPHGDDFRFVDIVWFDENQLFWEYLTTEKYLTESGNVPFWLMEESCAQMMLGAYRASQWVESGFGTYAESETRWSPNFIEISNNLEPWMQIKCTGKCLPIQDAKWRVSQLRFQYSCFVDGELFFQWNIVGNLIPKKLWERMTKKPS